jgi:phage terminase small subunit
MLNQMNSLENLTPKQKKFCQEYLVDLNATKAAIRAGYSEKTAKSQGQRLLTNVDLQEYLHFLMDERAQRTRANADEILERLDYIAKTAPKDNDKLRALELIGRHLGMFTDKIDVRQSGDIQLNIVRFSRKNHNGG